MLGIKKLKLPVVNVEPKLFILTLQKPGAQQRKFSVVHFDIGKAICSCYDSGSHYNINNYINHTELSVNEINSKFKAFNG